MDVKSKVGRNKKPADLIFSTFDECHNQNAEVSADKKSDR